MYLILSTLPDPSQSSHPYSHTIFDNTFLNKIVDAFLIIQFVFVIYRPNSTNMHLEI